MAARGRPKKDKKADLKVVGGHGEIGHNSKNGGPEALSDEQLEALTRQKASQRAKLVESEKAAKAKRMNFDKEIKAELGASGLKDIKTLEQLSSPEGEKEFREEMERKARVARWQSLEIGTQGALFKEDRRPLRDRAYDEGRRAGMAGEKCSPSYEGGEGYDGWMEGWHAGSAVASNQKEEQENGAQVLRMSSNERPASDAFDEAADDGAPSPAEDQEASAEAQEPESAEAETKEQPDSEDAADAADPGDDLASGEEGSLDTADSSEAWPDEQQISEREQPDEL